MTEITCLFWIFLLLLMSSFLCDFFGSVFTVFLFYLHLSTTEYAPQSVELAVRI